MTRLALPIALLTAAAAPAFAQSAPEPAPDLRSLAEIDGDPATFTADERRKLQVLAQVLGTEPTDPAPVRAELDRTPRSAKHDTPQGL